MMLSYNEVTGYNGETKEITETSMVLINPLHIAYIAVSSVNKDWSVVYLAGFPEDPLIISEPITAVERHLS